MTRSEKQAAAVKVGFVLFHAACLLVLVTGVSAVALVVAACMYLVRGLGVTAGYHRYFAHKSFRTSRPFQFLLGFAGSLSTQGGLLWWVSHHRDHHRYTETEKDMHSPRMGGLWHAHMGWMMKPDCFQTTGANVKDLHKYPEIKWLQRHYVTIMFGQAVFLFGLGAALNFFWPQLGTSGLQMLVWGYFISTVALWHSTFMVNSVCHRWGRSPYDAHDDSTNNWLVAFLALGEGWHNNHHKFAGSARHGLEWWQFDITWLVLRTLEKLGVVHDLKVPRPAQLAAKKARTQAVGEPAGEPAAEAASSGTSRTSTT